MGTKLVKMNSESKQTVRITAEEYSLVKAIWKRIEFEPKVHGTGFYLRFFAKYPQYIKYYLADESNDDVNPDALMTIKFTVIVEILGYLILDFHNKPKQFNELMGYLGMMHKDMRIDMNDANNFCLALIDYLRETMTDLMTETCEAAVVTFFRSIQELLINSIDEERRRFDQEEKDALVTRSRFEALLPCACPDRSKKLVYGQPREYWVLRKLDWASKIESWEREAQVVPVTPNLQNTVESTSSDDEGFEKFETREEFDLETSTGYFKDKERKFLQTQRTNRLASVPHFDQHDSEFSVISEANDLMDGNSKLSTENVRLTPRERRRVEAIAVKSLRLIPSGRLISSTDTGTPRYSDESAARERRRRSTWN